VFRLTPPSCRRYQPLSTMAACEHAPIVRYQWAITPAQMPSNAGSVDVPVRATHRSSSAMAVCGHPLAATGHIRLAADSEVRGSLGMSLPSGESLPLTR
jgi:hypothetical protein